MSKAMSFISLGAMILSMAMPLTANAGAAGGHCIVRPPCTRIDRDQNGHKHGGPSDDKGKGDDKRHCNNGGGNGNGGGNQCHRPPCPPPFWCHKPPVHCGNGGDNDKCHFPGVGGLGGSGTGTGIGVGIGTGGNATATNNNTNNITNTNTNSNANSSDNNNNIGIQIGTPAP